MTRLLLAVVAALAWPLTATASQFFGTVNKGRIEGSVPLPDHGPNFSP